MKIVQTPNPILTQKAKPVKKIDSNIRRIIKTMQKLLKESKIGVGLAAPQVGLSLKLFIAAPDLANPKKRKKAKYFTFINPVLKTTINKQLSTNNIEDKPKAESRKPTLEGCLSIPNIWGKVTRSPKVQISFTDENGKATKKTFTGLMAIIIQHEMDHLSGTLFTSHVFSQKEQLYEQIEDEKTGETEMKEIEI